MNLLLSEDVPLRTTRELGDFAVDQVLPHRYGDLTAAPFGLVKLTASRWLAADHAMSIASVYVDDEATSGWAAAVESDATGHAITVVELAAPAPTDAVVSACGTGKRHATTGALIENPADIAADLMRLCGRTTTWPAFRAECSVAGLRLAGSLDSVASLRVQLDRVMQSAGAIWTPEMARLYPATAVVGPVLELDRYTAGELAVSASIEDTCDILRLGYDPETVSGRPQQHVELTASPQRFGGVTRTLDLAYLRLPGNAEGVGRRVLGRLAGERYDVSFASSRTDLRPGQWVRLVAHPEWPFTGADPVLMVLGVEVRPGSRSIAVTAEHIRAAATVAVTQHSVAVPAEAEAGVDVSYRNGTATLTFVDADGRPLRNARVAMDGGAAKTTDARGVVQFSAASGTHTVAVEATGHVPFTFQIVL